MEWLLEEAASRTAQTSWARMGYRQTGHGRRHARSFSSGTDRQAPDGHHGRARYGPAPLAPLAVRGAHASAAGALQAEGGPGAPEAGDEVREQAERRSEEVVRMAQEHYFPWRPEW